jgi:hypothetical protein
LDLSNAKQEKMNAENARLARFRFDQSSLSDGSENVEAKSTMSCKIDRVVTDGNLVVLSISGWITGEHVDLLRGLLEHEADAVVVDLRNVPFVDREAVKLLALIEAKGSELRNCPLYVREWVTRETMTKDIEDA